MPVPESSYSRRYGREDSYSSYTRSTSSTGLGRSYLSSYGSKASSSLPPRPPAYDIRKYTDTSSLTGSRFLSSSTGSRSSVSRDYGSSYRSSVSPVRASASSIRRQLEASAPSIAERIKAIETSENDDGPSATSTSGISRVSRYSTLRAQRESPTYDASATRSKYATYSSGYTRDRSGSREYGSSPLSVTGSTYLSRSSDNKSSTENIRSRTSPAPLSRSGSGNNASGGSSSGGLRNGTASTEVNDSTPETSSSSAASASNSKSVLATTTTTTNKPALENATSVVTTTPPVSNEPADEDTKPDRSSLKSKDVENNDSRRRRRISGAGGSEVGSANSVSSTAASSSSVYMNGNDEEAEGRWSSKKSSAKVVKDSYNNSSAVNMASSSSPASANNVSSSSSSSIGNSYNKSGGKTVSSITSTTQDSNGNPIVSITMETPKNKDSVESFESKSSVGSFNAATVAPSSSLSTSSSRLGRFRKYESDSNANNIVVSEPTTTATTPPISSSLLTTNTTNKPTPSLTNGDASTKEKSPVEAVLTFKPRSSASSGGSTNKPSISPSGSRTKMTNSNTSSTEVSVKPKVLYHTIQVEEPAASRENTASPEPVYTLRARPSLDGTAPKIELNKGPPAPRKEERDKEVDAEDVCADFKIVLPKLKLSTANSSSQESVHNNKSGTSSSEDDTEGVKSSGMMNSVSSAANKDEEPPIRTVRESPPKVTSVLRKSLTPKKEESPPPVVTPAIPTSSTTNSSSRKSSSSREATPTRSHLLTRKSPSPGLGSSVKSTRASPDNINAASSELSPSMGPHMSKNVYGTATAISNIASPSNRNERMRNTHIVTATTSDSSDNDSDAYSTSPKLGGGKFRSNKESGGYEKAGLTGLRNIGNTCFMNTVLQCLSNTKPLLEYVMKDNYEGDINRTTSGMKGALIRAFGELIHELWRDQRVVDTSAFKDQIQRFAPRFMGYSQQDAQEFLRYLLEGLHEDVNRVTSKPTPILTDIDDSFSDSEKAAEAWKRYLRYENSKVFDMFVGQLKSTLKCTVCGHCSVTFDPFWDLSLPIPSRSSSKLTSCFELFTKEEVLDGDEKPTCAKCQCRRKCTKSFSIQKFPKILVIHLKRFSLAERYRGKLSTLVDYPLTGLDLSLLAATRTQGTHVYNLYGVANHSGSTYSGHYIAYCKHPYTGEWNCYNDSRVSPISPSSVVTSEGYVLFYEQAGQTSLL